jgi:hypothetical protein
MKTTYTQFSFQLLQLWMKKFYIELDLSALDSDDPNPADVFGGCEIEFYLFTHHLAGAFLYNDWNMDDTISVNYVTRINESAIDPDGAGPLPKPNYKNPDGTDMLFPDSNELSHQLILGEVDEFDFKSPKT